LRGGPTSPPVAGIIKTGKQPAARRIEALLAIEYPPCPNLGEVTDGCSRLATSRRIAALTAASNFGRMSALGGEPDTPGWRE